MAGGSYALPPALAAALLALLAAPSCSEGFSLQGAGAGYFRRLDYALRQQQQPARLAPVGMWASWDSSAPSASSSSPLSSTAAIWAETHYPEAIVLTSDASTMAGALADVWSAICAVIADRSSSRLVMIPEVDSLSDRRVLQDVYDHLELCQDCCESFGQNVAIFPIPAGKDGSPAAAFEVRPIRGGSGKGSSQEEFGYDPLWDDDDDWDIDRSMLPEGYEMEESQNIVKAELLNSVPDSEEEILRITKTWNEAVIAGLGVCPFAVNAEKAGLPVGQIHYPISGSTTAEAVYHDYWREVEYLLSSDERSVSTTLLVTPQFGLENVEAFDILSTSLTQPLELLGLETAIQLVFFHPQHSFRDGQDRLGQDEAANFARRSPFPMINILRTPQVRLAQKSIPTGLVYKQNEDTLQSVGAATLQDMLETRDWSGLQGLHVDRRHAAEYFQTAREMQGLQGLGGDIPSSVSSSAPSAVPRSKALSQPLPPKPKPAPISIPPNAKANIEKEDIRLVVEPLLKRLRTQKPLDADTLASLSRGLTGILQSTDPSVLSS
jgi:hypothetical protein